MTGTTRSDGLQFNAAFSTRGSVTPAPLPVARTRVRIRPARAAFALALIGLGLLGLIYGDFALVWQRIPIEYLPGRTFIAYACALVELATGVGLLLYAQLARGLPPHFLTGDRNAWTALVISCAITFGAWAVADARVEARKGPASSRPGSVPYTPATSGARSTTATAAGPPRAG